MPIHEYECLKCKELYEHIIIYGRPEIIKCPNCGSRKRDKLISRVCSPWNRRDLDQGFAELDHKKRKQKREVMRTSRRVNCRDPENP